MVVYCCVNGCFNRRETGNKIHFFSFPLKNEVLNALWVNAINRKGFSPSKASRICSDHFKLGDFKDTPGGSYRLYLANHACPSIFPDELQSKKKKPNKEEDYTFVQHFDSALGRMIPTTKVKEKLSSDSSSCKENLAVNTSLLKNESIILRDELLKTPTKVQRPLFKVSPKSKKSEQPVTPKKKLLNQKLKCLQQKVRRQSRKINNLKNVLKNLRNEQLLDNESESLLLDKFEGLPLQ